MSNERPLNPEQKFFAGFEQKIVESQAALAGPGGKSLFLDMFQRDLQGSGLTELDGLPVKDAIAEMTAAIHDQKRVEDILPSVRGLFMRMFPDSLSWRPQEGEPVVAQPEAEGASVTHIARGQEIKEERMFGDELMVSKVLLRSTTIGEIVDKLNELKNSLPGINGEAVAAEAVQAYNEAKAGHPERLEKLPDIVKPSVRKVLLSEELKTIY